MATDKDKTHISLNNSSFKSYCKIKTNISPEMKRNSFKVHHNDNMMASTFTPNKLSLNKEILYPYQSLIIKP